MSTKLRLAAAALSVLLAGPAAAHGRDPRSRPFVQRSGRELRHGKEPSALGCGVTDFSNVKALRVFFQPGVHRIDNVRVE